MKVRDVMHAPVVTCFTSASVAAVAREMETHNVGSVVVVSSANELLGIVTDRDIALAVGRDSQPEAPVDSIMSRNVVTIGVDADANDGADAMDSHGIRRLPVLDTGNRLVGMVCLDDLIAHLVDETIALHGAIRVQKAH